MEAFVALVVIAAFAALAVAIVNANRRHVEQLKMTFSWLGEKLGGTYDVDKRIAEGELAGANVTFRMTKRGSGKHASYWTEIDAEIPKPYPLRLFVRKHGWFDQGKIERGDLVDVIVGDPAFDDRFLVEAAPAEVARILLDPRERSYLLALGERLHFDIDTIRSTEPPRLRLSVRQWIYDINDALRAVEAMAAIAGRVREAYAAVERAADVTDRGSPYRPALDDTTARAAADARLEEVARIDRLNTARIARQQTFAAVLVIGFVLFVILAVAAGN